MLEKSHEETYKEKIDFSSNNTNIDTDPDTDFDTDTNAQSYRITNHEFVFSLFSNIFMNFFFRCRMSKSIKERNTTRQDGRAAFSQFRFN